MFGTRELLDKLHEKFGGEKKLSEPRTPVIGSIAVTLRGKPRTIEVLHSIGGLGGRQERDRPGAPRQIREPEGAAHGRL